MLVCEGPAAGVVNYESYWGSIVIMGEIGMYAYD